jgi:predicted molibdopterin-dependent oxidoreductase YjgC
VNDVNRIRNHPVLGELEKEEPSRTVGVWVDGVEYRAREGEMIAAMLLAYGVSAFRRTVKNHSPRGIYCGIGRCTDCVMTVDGIPNVRTCVTPVREGMSVETQQGMGRWREESPEGEDHV